jgi:hypothetical protein
MANVTNIEKLIKNYQKPNSTTKTVKKYNFGVGKRLKKVAKITELVLPPVGSRKWQFIYTYFNIL